MEIRERENLLEVVHTDTCPPGTPTAGDLRLSVSVASDGFAGSSPHVWVDGPSFAYFVKQLRELEAKRQGAARLEAMSSPDEFRLEVRSIDRAGHMAVFGRLQRWQFLSTSYGEDYCQVVEFGFEFCPSLLPGIVSGFQAMGSVNS